MIQVIFNRDIHRNEKNHKLQKMMRMHEKTELQNQVRVNLCLNMENQERFKNVCLGFAIQADRLMHFAGGLQQYQIEQAEQATNIMKQIQQCLVEIAAEKEKYDQHLNNAVYCKKVINPYVKALEQVIADVDVLVKGGVNNVKTWKS